jgi:glycosyltransferase involved in cell wall biosynthesis
METCPVSEDKIIVIPDAVSVNDLNPDKYDRDIIRSEMGFSEKDTVIGLIGRMTPGKGHEIFFECVKLISQVISNVKFMVVGAASYGESEYEKKLMDFAESMKIKDKILFTGYRENIPYYLSAIDILAFPSHRESFGGTVLEAMAMKVPVVAFASGGVKELIFDNYTGILVPSISVKEFTNALLTLINNRELCRRLGNNAREVVKNKFEINSNMLIFNELYTTILNENKL